MQKLTKILSLSNKYHKKCTETSELNLNVVVANHVVLLQMAEKRPKSPPLGYKKVQTHLWEKANPRVKRNPVNGHTGIYAYHCDDCMCGMAGWPCYRDGHIWSCCGETEKYCKCTGSKE